MFLLLATSHLAAVGLNRDDLIAVHETSDPPHEAIAVGRHETQIVIGKYRRVSKKYVELTRLARDRSPRTQRINLNLHDFTVEGVVVGAIRSDEVPLAKMEA